MARKSSREAREQWRGRLLRFEHSKLSVAEFCRQEKVSEPSFYQWRKKLGKIASEASLSTNATFLPVQVTATTGLQVSFPNGATLTIPIEDYEFVMRFTEAVALTRTTAGEV